MTVNKEDIPVVPAGNEDREDEVLLNRIFVICPSDRVFVV